VAVGFEVLLGYPESPLRDRRDTLELRLLGNFDVGWHVTNSVS
jgi:hypothetical protein